VQEHGLLRVIRLVPHEELQVVLVTVVMRFVEDLAHDAVQGELPLLPLLVGELATPGVHFGLAEEERARVTLLEELRPRIRVLFAAEQFPTAQAENE
jgi:hypothetical protein